MDAKAVLLDVGDRPIDFQCLADRLAALDNLETKTNSRGRVGNKGGVSLGRDCGSWALTELRGYVRFPERWEA